MNFLPSVAVVVALGFDGVGVAQGLHLLGGVALFDLWLWSSEALGGEITEIKGRREISGKLALAFGLVAGVVAAPMIKGDGGAVEEQASS